MKTLSVLKFYLLLLIVLVDVFDTGAQINGQFTYPVNAETGIANYLINEVVYGDVDSLSVIVKKNDHNYMNWYELLKIDSTIITEQLPLYQAANPSAFDVLSANLDKTKEHFLIFDASRNYDTSWIFNYHLKLKESKKVGLTLGQRNIGGAPQEIEGNLYFVVKSEVWDSTNKAMYLLRYHIATNALDTFRVYNGEKFEYLPYYKLMPNLDLVFSYEGKGFLFNDAHPTGFDFEFQNQIVQFFWYNQNFLVDSIRFSGFRFNHVLDYKTVNRVWVNSDLFKSEGDITFQSAIKLLESSNYLLFFTQRLADKHFESHVIKIKSDGEVLFQRKLNLERNLKTQLRVNGFTQFEKQSFYVKTLEDVKHQQSNFSLLWRAKLFHLDTMANLVKKYYLPNDNPALYPNPAKGFVDIITQTASSTEFTLFNLQGQIVFQRNIENVFRKRIWLTNVVSGTYIYMLRHTDTKEGFYYGKLVVEP